MNKNDLEIPIEEMGSLKNNRLKFNMNDVVKDHNIIFLCLDTLRFDIALQEEENGGTPNLNKYGKWIKCHAPGNYTLPSHMAMFTGFFPSPVEPIPLFEREHLFLPSKIGTNTMPKTKAFQFSETTFMQGLEKIGYETYCIGGVGFFDKRTEIGKLLPSFFKHSYWQQKFSCIVKESATHQVDFAIKKLSENIEGKSMMYINFSAIHYPNSFYTTSKVDNVDSHAAALRYVDEEIGRLFEEVKKINPKTLVIVCSDHGTCYGEDGYIFHCNSHQKVIEVPYKHFFL